MTKKEMLKQEAEEWLNKWELCNKCDHKVQCIEDNAMCPQVVERAYLAGAEPREKRIAELEKRCANYEMTISKMEKGTCDICKEIEKDKRITELEMTVGTLRTFSNEQATCIEELEKACEETQELLDKQIEATYRLDKENAELKHTIATLRQEKDNVSMHAKAMEVVAKTRSDQLTKAKEILKSLYFIIESRIDYKNNIEIADEMWRAEQFWKGEK